MGNTCVEIQCFTPSIVRVVKYHEGNIIDNKSLNYSPTTFTDNEQGMTFDSEVGGCCNYYFMYGDSADGVIARIRELTGQVPMFPLWTFGFWQSKERYTSQDEIIGVVEKYRSLHIPLDGIIQDWQYWGTNYENWNSTEFRNPKFPNLQLMLDKIHNLNAHAMISVWGSFGPNTRPFGELKQKNLLMNFETFPQNYGVKVYDAYNPQARDVYWKYLNRNLFKLGMDAWWLDSTEPDHYPTKEEDFDNKTYLGSFRKVRNAFPLMSVGGVCEHQRQTTSDKRVFILTRSAFTGQQRYAANSWSGDINSDWGVFRKQIPAGMNFSLVGIPYWNTDIGGFWAHFNYPKGVKDLAFQELYVRWMQFATFTPMMRSHGSGTPREIFNFGERGNWAFDAQEKYINLRYRLLPYIYSTSWQVAHDAGSMMRALFMDFPEDNKVENIDNEYLFGKSILVAPVTDSLYVSRASGKAVVDFTRMKTHTVYLPQGTQWIDFWTGETKYGGQKLEREVPIDIIPLYVKAGSILPMGPSVQYATEKPWTDLQIGIYPGTNGEFTLYEDENDNYNYEKGGFFTILMKWNNNNWILLFPFDMFGLQILENRKAVSPYLIYVFLDLEMVSCL
ncbi:TIM-barrel domain-containing protein [uncultured Bacteroides sp.]|uniref:TIM-barrel domain-containing protein n=1 Tax=uncultured Bacteroides sp. TaxID=162156 RepID=UPI002AA89BAD|nr:TIM-barrel domain-containing protein [uncultured Bacteroides sp.]